MKCVKIQTSRFINLLKSRFHDKILDITAGHQGENEYRKNYFFFDSKVILYDKILQRVDQYQVINFLVL